MSIFNANDLAMIPQTEIEKLMIIFLWQAEEISEGKAAEVLGLGRLEARGLRDKFINQALAKFGEKYPRKTEPSENFDGTTVSLSEWIKREFTVQKNFDEILKGNGLDFTEKIKAEFSARFSNKYGIQIPKQCLAVEFKSKNLFTFRITPGVVVSIMYPSENGEVDISFGAKLDWHIENGWPVFNLSDDVFSQPLRVFVLCNGENAFKNSMTIFEALEEAAHRFGPMVGEL